MNVLQTMMYWFIDWLESGVGLICYGMEAMP